MARLTAAEVERFKRNTDLVALVRQHGVALKKHGSRDLAGCCPFHAEKTASFIVTPSKNLFHCLGCGAAGGPIDFIMKSQNLPFRAAVSGRGAACTCGCSRIRWRTGVAGASGDGGIGGC